jgi:hypothetical protein
MRRVMMGVLDSLLGPQSKYVEELPYTYEARMPIIEGDDEFNSYMSDTICGLVNYLYKSDIAPREVKIYEIYTDKEKLIPKELYLTADGEWLQRDDICQSFKDYYKGHIYEGGCTFEDRNCKGTGP